MHDSFQPECFYHVYNHAVGNENLFRKRDNYIYFLKKMSQYLSSVCDVYAYCLLPNHFHLLIRIKNEVDVLDYHKIDKHLSYDFHTLVMRRFKNFFSGYSQAYNKMYERRGALFLDFVKQKQVKNDTYFTKLIHYIHYNPIHHHFCSELDAWEFSSYHAFLSSQKTLLKRKDVLEWFGNRQDFIKFHRKEIDFPDLDTLLE